jgi:Flp pilus assembly protein TadG
MPLALRYDARGVAAIEMAIALPILLTFVMGIISYGDWFLTSHTVQQAANDAARAAIAGLTADERSTIATSNVKTMLTRGGALNPTKATTSTTSDPATQTMKVVVVYDASQDPLLRMSFIAPPPNMITRSAAINLGGM